jgi:hypothetical protein
MPIANTHIGSTVHLRTAMLSPAPSEPEITKSKAATNALCTGRNLSRCIGLSMSCLWHSSAIRILTSHRSYAYGVGGSPIGAQVNFVHFRRVEPFFTSGGGFVYFNHRMFGTAQQFNFTAQLGGGVQFFTHGRRSALDIGYKYHHISNANLGNQNPGLDSHMLFIGVSLFR